MKEGLFYEHLYSRGLIVFCTTSNPMFAEGVVLHDPNKRKLTGKVEFLTVRDYKEFKGSILITTI